MKQTINIVVNDIHINKNGKQTKNKIFKKKYEEKNRNKMKEAKKNKNQNETISDENQRDDNPSFSSLISIV